MKKTQHIQIINNLQKVGKSLLLRHKHVTRGDNKIFANKQLVIISPHTIEQLTNKKRKT